MRSHCLLAIITLSMAALPLAACGANAAPTGLGQLRAACESGTAWDGARCVPWGAGIKLAATGEAQLEEGQVDQAIKSFEAAVDKGPHAYADHVRIFEQLGIAHAYREDDASAKKAFTTLLMLEPGHLLSYNLSPRATLKFEQARTAVTGKPVPAVDVSWPVDNEVSRPIPVSVEIVADPIKTLRRATLYVRDLAGGPTRAADVELGASGERVNVTLPALGGNQPRTLALHLVARDDRGSEVLLWASDDQPRRVQVDYTPPTPLLKKWWFWAGLGSVVAVGAGTTVYLLTREPGDFVDGINP